MSMELGFGIAIAGVALLIYADYLKIPRTRINALAWGVPISLIFIGSTRGLHESGLVSLLLGRP